MTYPVCILAAGLGSRLEGLTRKLNKAMVEVAGRPAICRIIERFPCETRFVVATGHKGALLQEFLRIAYPSIEFQFVEVFPYEGPESGLGLSLLRCEDLLQEPFIFTACDTLVDKNPPAPTKNWMGYSQRGDLSSYRTLRLEDGFVAEIHSKMESPPKENVAYIGLAGINQYAQFWRQMNELREISIREGEVTGLEALLHLGIYAIPFGWHDTGTLASLFDARQEFKNLEEANILEKENEAIWFLNDEVIKYCDDKSFIKSRVARAEHLEGYVPRISRSSDHFYVYKKAEGSIFSSVVTPIKFDALLSHAENFWEGVQLDPITSREFSLACFEFYKTKTDKRVEAFFTRYGLSDTAQEINGDHVPKLFSILQSVDWEDISQGIPSRFHGDFHFENILFNDVTKDFVYLDWRQDFAGNLTVGDRYYDLAKLMHGLLINHKIISDNNYSVSWQDERIEYDFLRPNKLVECERAFVKWLANNNYSVQKVYLICALIFLNIATLHHDPYAKLLFALGKKMLYERTSDELDAPWINHE